MKENTIFTNCICNNITGFVPWYNNISNISYQHKSTIRNDDRCNITHVFTSGEELFMFLTCYIFLFCFECLTTTFLRAHSWLNWVDEDDDEDEVGLKEKTLDTSKRLHRNKTEAPGVWTEDLINFIPIYCHHWDCRLGLVQVRQA